MPFQTVNGARLYYEALGQREATRAPLVLIHGATSTGQADWAGMAGRLAAAGHYVLVPDSRGHGQSENPKLSYAFDELAADTAALIGALGFERAHVVGHSNGGNVALLLLMEHPEVIQTCVLQAANAYVSADLAENEPRIFDPDRVAREAPAWRDEMMALHGPTHGPTYWRDLLRLTVRAIVTGPNYTPADLARVRRPVLVIQGANDTVNALGRHAEFIAEHIPEAELWLPEGVGHTVHRERADAWLARVVDFIQRRA